MASADWDHTVRAKMTGLPAGTPMFYRVVAGRDLSDIGNARTAPSATATAAQLSSRGSCTGTRRLPLLKRTRMALAAGSRLPVIVDNV